MAAEIVAEVKVGSEAVPSKHGCWRAEVEITSE